MVFENVIVERIFYSIIIILAASAINWIITHHIHSRLRRYGLRSDQEKILKKAIWLFLIAAAIVALVSAWDLGIRNLWVYITSIMGLVAIGFVAVWSILSNILSGLILLLGKTYRIGNTIEIIGEDVKGKIADITFLFTSLEDKKGDTINIPNNMLLQKAIRVLKS